MSVVGDGNRKSFAARSNGFPFVAALPRSAAPRLRPRISRGSVTQARQSKSTSPASTLEDSWSRVVPFFFFFSFLPDCTTEELYDDYDSCSRGILESAMTKRIVAKGMAYHEGHSNRGYLYPGKRMESGEIEDRKREEKQRKEKQRRRKRDDGGRGSSRMCTRMLPVGRLVCLAEGIG